MGSGDLHETSPITQAKLGAQIDPRLKEDRETAQRLEARALDQIAGQASAQAARQARPQAPGQTQAQIAPQNGLPVRCAVPGRDRSAESRENLS